MDMNQKHLVKTSNLPAYYSAMDKLVTKDKEYTHIKINDATNKEKYYYIE